MTGLGYDLVDAEKSVGGLLRVYIDRVYVDRAVDRAVDRVDRVRIDDSPGQGNEPRAEIADMFITVDDCEKVTRQLQHVLEVEGCAYERLEVSSPGLDRPLKKAADYARFAGRQIEITLKLPFKGRKKFSGELQPIGDTWRLVLEAPRAVRAAKRAAAAGAETDQALDFSLDEVREAHLVPVVDFKGRRFVAPEVAAEAGLPDEKVIEKRLDGGRIQ